jgi:hypothetical protein
MIDPMTENLVAFAVVALLGIVTALVCNRFLGVPKNKRDNRQNG